MNLLNPEKEEIEESVRKFESEWGYSDCIIYNVCVDDVKRKKMSQIGHEEIKNAIKTFLINWGMMSRVLNSKKDDMVDLWQGKLKKAFENLPQLEKFREMEMEVENLEPHKNDIIICYSKIKDVVKPTSASKVLHLLCPEFFPMWDQKIRNNARNELKTMEKSKKIKINENGEGYYNFMCEIKNFLDKYNKTINQLSVEHQKDKLKIIDEYLWMRK